MRMRTTLGGVAVAVAAALATGAPVEAQNPAAPRAAMPAPPAATGEIRGGVLDADTKQPIASATVEVWSKADTTLVAGAIARPDGGFRIEGLRPGIYRLRVTMLGYATQSTADIALTPAAPVATVPPIALAPQAIQLEGVTAEAARAMIIAPDRNSYSAKQVAPAATSASDVLESVPSVQVDADGKVSLRGSENVVVQINGRPTPVRGAQLAGYLKQLPANTIERVEVIPNPSAKHDPEGMAGIINIVMKQGVDLGTSGGFMLAASTADRYNVGANVGHQSGPLALAASYGFVSDERSLTGVNDRTRLQSGSPSSYTEQDLDGEMTNQGHNFTLNADYTFNPRDVLSATLLLNRREAGDGTLTSFAILDGAREQTDAYDRFRDSDSRNWLGDVALSFKRTLVPQKHEVSAEIRANRQDDAGLTGIWRLGTQPERFDVETQNLDALTTEIAGQVDYTRTLRSTLKLETGYKGSGRWLDRDYLVLEDAEGTGSWQPSALSNALEFDERVNAVYGVLSRAGTKYDVQAGLRLEHASRDFTLRDTQQDFPHSYSSLYPSALVTWKANDKSQLRLSYSRRVRRPARDELNPFPWFLDVQNALIGNPRLDPEYTDAMELSYQRSMQLGSLQVSPFFRRTSGVISIDINPADTIDGREVTTARFRNLDHNTSWGADVNGQLRLGSKANGLAAFNVAKVVTDGGSETALSTDAVAWSVRLNATYNVRPTTALTGSWFYRGPVELGRGRMESMGAANFSVTQRFRDNRAAFTARISDPFNQQKFAIRISDDELIQFTDRAFTSRALHLSLQYSTGQTPKLRQRRQEEQVRSANPFGQ